MKQFIIAVMVCWAFCSHVANVTAAPIQVPLGQVPGQQTHVGTGTSNDAAGGEVNYHGFDASQFTQMYFGINPSPPSQFNQPTVTLDETITTLIFADVEGTTAIWQGSTVVDLTGNGPMTVPLQFLVDVSGLGNNPWLDPASVSLPAAMGIAIADPAGLSFDVHTYFQGDYGSGFVPLDQAPIETTGGRVGSVVGFAFFVVRPVPEPGSLALAIAGLSCYLAWVVLRRSASTH